MLQHLHVIVCPLDATVLTVHTAQLVIADAQVKQYCKEVTATTHAAAGAAVIIDG